MMYFVTCAICGYQGQSNPADLSISLHQVKVRSCLTTNNVYPALPDLWICDIHVTSSSDPSEDS